MIADRKGDEFLAYMQNEYLLTLNLGPQISQEFCQALKSDQKIFRNYFKVSMDYTFVYVYTVMGILCEC